MLDEKIQRTKALIEQREAIDAELSELLGITAKPKRGRPSSKEKDPAETGSSQGELTAEK